MLQFLLREGKNRRYIYFMPLFLCSPIKSGYSKIVFIY